MVLGLWCEIGSFGFVLIEQPGFICALSNVLPLVISPPSFSTIQVHYKHDLKIRMILWLIWKQVKGFLHQECPTDIWMYVQREVLQSSIGVWPPWRNLVNTCHHKFFLLLFPVHKSMTYFFFLQVASHVSFHQHPDALSLQHQFFAYAWSHHRRAT